MVCLPAEGSGGLRPSSRLGHLSARRFDRVFTFSFKGNSIMVSVRFCFGSPTCLARFLPPLLPAPSLKP